MNESPSMQQSLNTLVICRLHFCGPRGKKAKKRTKTGKRHATPRQPGSTCNSCIHGAAQLHGISRYARLELVARSVGGRLPLML